MRKSALGVMLLLFMISFVIAEDTSKIRTDVDLKIPFEVNGSAASGSATCNVTLLYPNQTAVFNNKSATNNNNGIFNITFTSEENVALGSHEWIAFCCDGVNCASGYGNLKITSTGGERGFTLFLILIISAMILFIFAYYTEIEFLVFFSGVLFLVGGIYSMIYGIGDVTDLYTRAIAGILLGIGMVMIVASIYNLGKGEDLGDY